MPKLLSQGQLSIRAGLAPFLPVSAADEEGQAPAHSSLTRTPRENSPSSLQMILHPTKKF